MALAIATITESMTGISVAIPDLRIYDKHEIKEGWTAYDCPLLAPRPNDFISGLTVIPVNFGTGTAHKLDVSYTMTYRYFHKPVGSGDLAFTWSEMVDYVYKIFDAILINDALTGLIDLTLTSVSEFGEVVDGANNLFHGCDISFRVLEFVN